MNHLFDYLQGVVSKETEQVLENLYNNSRIFESNEFVKGEQTTAPIETVYKVDNVEYIKLDDGWNILEKAEKEEKVKKSVKKEKTREQLELEASHKQNVEKPSIQEGHEITAPDGTSGKVTAHDGKMITVEYVKDGQKAEAQVPAYVLEERKAKGEIQHNANPKTLKELHMSLIEEMHIQDKDATAIIGVLKTLGVDEGEALEAVNEYVKAHPKKEEKKETKKVEKAYMGGANDIRKAVITNLYTPESKPVDEIEKAGHPPKFHEKHWNVQKQRWDYDYGQHLPKGSAEKLEDSGYSQREEQHQRKMADDITSTISKIETHLKEHDDTQKEIVRHQQSIQAIKNHDGRDNKSTNPMKSKLHELGTHKDKQITIVKHLHNNLITRLTR